MHAFCTRLIPFFTACALLPVPMAHAADGVGAGAEDLVLTYSIHVGGMHVLDATANVALQEGGYRAGLVMQTDGFLGRVAKWQTDVRAHGNFAGPLPRPRQFTAHGSWRDEPRLTTVDYAPDGMPNVTLAQPEPEKDREPVPMEMRNGTVDPVTAIVAVMDRVARSGGCDITVPVYDGRQRYDLIFATQGTEQLEAGDLSTYAGPATRCTVRYKPMAGRWKEQRPNRDDDGAKRKDVPVTLYVAKAHPGGPPVPVRLEMNSSLGPVRLHLASIRPKGTLE